MGPSDGASDVAADEILLVMEGRDIEVVSDSKEPGVPAVCVPHAARPTRDPTNNAPQTSTAVARTLCFIVSSSFKARCLSNRLTVYQPVGFDGHPMASRFWNASRIRTADYNFDKPLVVVL